MDDFRFPLMRHWTEYNSIMRSSYLTDMSAHLAASETLIQTRMRHSPAALRRAVDDFRFPLMRHWTVYDSIIHSRYVAVRLHTWQEKGKDKVKELLVRMGLSQRDCQADYCESPWSCCHLHWFF